MWSPCCRFSVTVRFFHSGPVTKKMRGLAQAQAVHKFFLDRFASGLSLAETSAAMEADRLEIWPGSSGDACSIPVYPPVSSNMASWTISINGGGQ